MPTINGIECAHLLQERHPKTRVILISGSIFEDKRPHPDERGTDAYLEKSKVPERLHATILALCGRNTRRSARPNKRLKPRRHPIAVRRADEFEFNLPLQALGESFVRATSRYVDERAARSRERVAFPPQGDAEWCLPRSIERAPA